MTNLATTHDHLLNGQLCLEQPAKGYRFGTDAMLLAAAIRAKPGETVLELGCGVGAALLVAALRLPDVTLTGIERDPIYAALADKNIQENALTGRVMVIEGSLHDKTLGLPTYHHVMANPPYFNPDTHPEGDNLLRRTARHEEPDGLVGWIKAANRLCRPKGTVTIIHRTERLPDIITAMQAFCGAITVFPLWPNTVTSAKLVIIQGIKGSKAPLVMHPGLVLHDDSNHYYTPRADAVIRNGRSIWE